MQLAVSFFLLYIKTLFGNREFLVFTKTFVVEIDTGDAMPQYAIINVF